MKITVRMYKESPNLRFLEEAIELANFCQSYFYYQIEHHNDELLSRNEKGKANYRKAIDIVYNIFGKHAVFVTDAAFDNNYFSYTGPLVGVITTADWSEKFAPPSLTAFLAREIVLSSICFCANVTEQDIDRISRDPSIGCVFDFCDNKADIRFGLVAGYISLETKAELLRHRVDQRVIDAAEKVLNLIRLDAIGKPFHFNREEAFIVMKFGQHDENTNSYEHGIKPALTEFGLIPTRADDDPQMKTLSEKVLEHIEKSRLVVIKVDEISANVYFELGYARALKKDLLLVCRSSQVANVPID